MTRMTDVYDVYENAWDKGEDSESAHLLGLYAVADAAERRVLDRIEGERRYWDPRDAHRDLDDLIREMREELDRGDANG